MKAIWTALWHYVNTVPERLAWWEYNEALDHDLSKKEFWLRELCHAFGGILLAHAFFSLESFPNWLLALLVYVFFLVKEFLDDVPDQGGVPDWKNFVDPLFFALGCYLTLLISKKGF